MQTWDERFDAALREVIPPEHHAEITPDVELLGIGVDSLASMQLLMTLEDAYHIAFPMEALNADVFATPRTLWAAIVEAGADDSSR